MLGSYLLHYDLHYNGLMIDWGLSPTFLQKRGRFFQKRWRFFRKRWRFSERCPTFYFISCDIHAILSLDIASAQVLKLPPEEDVFENNSDICDSISSIVLVGFLSFP